MTEMPFEKAHASMRPGIGQVVVYRVFVGVMLVLAAVAVTIGRVAGGAKRTASIWQEAREAAHAVAGYAFKY